MDETKWYNRKWMVRIEKGFWMAGTHRFDTKKQASDFVNKWVHTELTRPDATSAADELRNHVKIERQYQY